MRISSSVDRLERASDLDRVVEPVQGVVRRLPSGRLRDVLHGVWLGHPVHPLLVQVPIGAWVSAGVLDLVPGAERSARRLVGVGLVAVAPAALAGWVDWAEQHEQQMRVGVVHALANAAATTLYGTSYLARRGGRTGLGRMLGFAGLATAGIGGLLGGHIAFRQAGGANHAEEVPHLVEPGWHDLAPLSELKDGVTRRMDGEVPLLVVRDGTEVQVLADRCSHFSGPLSDGEVADGCVTCPWHGSVFRLSDGGVVHGPATAPQPVFDVRLANDMVQIRLPGAG
jgi:nitrite reductase/ring-hydroxylating ferredoxin subunit/uncharacterized membrane protein